MKKALIVGVLLLLTIIIWNRTKKPSEYDCLSLGSDDARFMCLDKYYPKPVATIIPRPTPLPFPAQYLTVSAYDIDCENICVAKLRVKNSHTSNASNIKARIQIFSDETGKEIVNTVEIVFKSTVYANTTTEISNVILELKPKGKQWTTVTVISAEQGGL